MSARGLDRPPHPQIGEIHQIEYRQFAASADFRGIGTHIGAFQHQCADGRIFPQQLLRGLNDFSPQPWPARFKEIQAAGGRIDISQARVQQGETIAVGGGTLAINANGRLEGQLTVTVAGVEPFLAEIGAQQAVQSSAPMDKIAGALDRLAPGLGDVARQQATSSNLSLGLNLIGEQTTLEGRRALTLPLRFTDGAMFLGPIPIGKTPALF